MTKNLWNPPSPKKIYIVLHLDKSKWRLDTYTECK